MESTYSLGYSFNFLDNFYLGGALKPTFLVSPEFNFRPVVIELGLFYRRNFDFGVTLSSLPSVKFSTLVNLENLNLWSAGDLYICKNLLGFATSIGYSLMDEVDLIAGFSYQGCPEFLYFSTLIDFVILEFNYTIALDTGFNFVHATKIKYLPGRKVEKEKFNKEEYDKLVARMLLRIARAYYHEGRYEDCLRYCDIALVYDTTSRDARRLIKKTTLTLRQKEIQELLNEGKAHYGAGNYGEALSAFSKVLSYDSTNVVAQEYISKIQKTLKAREIQTEDITRYYQKALEAYSKGKYETAMRCAKLVLEMKPDFEEAKRLYNLARKKTQEAELRRKRAKIYVREGLRLYKEGNLAEAEAAFVNALKYDPTNITAKEYLRIIRSEIKRVTKKQIHEWYLRGVDAYTKDDFKTAIYWWKKILEVDPKNTKALEGVRRAEALLKQLEKYKM